MMNMLFIVGIVADILTIIQFTASIARYYMRQHQHSTINDDTFTSDAQTSDDINSIPS